MSNRKQIDWEAIEREYRAGQLSVREIARQHEISHTAVNKKAKEGSWVRDLTQKVRERVSTKLVSTEVSVSNAERSETEEEIIEHAATRGVQVVQSHRRDIQALRQTCATIQGILAERLEHAKELDVSKLNHTSGIVRNLSQALDKLIGKERQAFNLNDKGVPLEDVLTALPGEFGKAVRAALSDAL